jgi:4-hydroxy-tetrahydrodipicolinate synthase
MDRTRLIDSFRDVAFTTTVPFSEDGGEIRYDALADNLSRLYDAGARLLVPCGNTGEYYSLSNDERTCIVESHVEATGDEATIVGGAAGSFSNVRTLADAYENVGADALMVMHPRHTYMHESGLKEYYHQICDVTDLGVVIYKRGPEITRDVLAELSERENTVAVKFAVNDIKEFSQTVADTDGEVTWLNGLAERYVIPFVIEGAAGYTTGIGNFAPETTLELFDAVKTREWDRARTIQNAIRPYEDLRDEPDRSPFAAANNVPAVKYGMDLGEYYGGSVRAPLVDLSETDKNRAEEYYRRIDSRTRS